ncbi:FAD/NAD(P)-binding protein [Rhodococcus sp. NPDC080181]|uniref:FAD/NAD(P)-binding protein n=1 Tax=Rhodococcus sp. NPDC080181 TaxID=3155292 RepID=UPI00344DB74B
MTGHVAIIGAGAAGTAVLWAVARHGAAESIEIIDPLEPGRGRVFDTAHTLLRCNTSAAVMSLRADDVDDFVEYLRRTGAPSEPSEFVPRHLFGGYIRSCLREARSAAANRGLSVENQRARAMWVAPRVNGRGYRIGLDDGRSTTADHVLVAPGVGPPTVPFSLRGFVSSPTFFATPYPVDRVIHSLSARSRILVIGTRLSAVDSALTLGAAGHQVTLTSRSGELPAVRTSLRHNLVATLDTNALESLSIESEHLPSALLRLIRRATRDICDLPLARQTSSAVDPVLRMREELALADAGETLWQETIAQLIDVINDRLSRVDDPRVRGVAMQRGSRLVNRYISAIPTTNARLLMELIDAGQARVASGVPINIARTGNDGWRCTWRDGTQDFYDAIVCAAGFQPPTLSITGRGLSFSSPKSTGGAPPMLETDLRLRLPGSLTSEDVMLIGTASFTRVPIVNYVRTAVLQADSVARELKLATPAVRLGH